MMFCVNREITTFFKDSDAISYMERNSVPHMIISRYKDDNVNGSKIADFVKDQEEDCVFVFTSDSDNDKIVVENSAASAFLPIPFTINDLFEIVDEFIAVA